ncbi:DNA-binding protein [Microbacterium sp. STN6]|uniref:Jag family protein n=1 Tax=Microbacterium sp. STN6 TaxID=2995588 RepID=UPI002260A610|nr:R3H domain-containing nucleic acid-binding protein [Microbacterium sp. STN6]MCX7522762.1 DNA-binding protein [Microbacterium sp. STN6]
MSDTQTTDAAESAHEGVEERDEAQHSPAGDAADASATDGPSSDEGDVAADYIEELLDICDIDGDIDIDVRAGRTYISVHSDESVDLRLLSKPDTVNALQELARLAVQSSSGEFSRLILDIGGSREARQSELAAIVDRAIARIDEGAAQAALPAMSSYERKLVHDLVAERGYASNSEGEGRDRHTVITATA